MYHRRNRGAMNHTQRQQQEEWRDEECEVRSASNSTVGTFQKTTLIGVRPEPIFNKDDINKKKEDWKTKVLEGFTSLRNSPPELYKVYALKFLDSYSYFSFSIIFTLFLSDDFGYSDLQAGTIYGAWGAMITVYGFCTGFLVDNFGVSKSLKLGYALSFLARCGIFATTSRTWLLVHLYGTLPLANCLGIPVLMTGIRRYTHETNRGFAFGIFYVVMNVAALISGPIVDILTIWYKGGRDEAAADAPEFHGSATEDGVIINSAGVVKEWSLTSYRAIILSGILANAIACCISFTVREIKVESGSSTPVVQQHSDDDNDAVGVHGFDGQNHDEELCSSPPPRNNNITVFRPKTGTPKEILGEIWKSPSFRRYLLVVLIMLNVRQIFRHLDATWPKYMIREFGPDVPKGTIYAINPIMIIVLVPIISASTAHIDPLVMIHVGSYVSALSVFCLALSTTIWSSCVFMVLLSIGEAIWSPRLNDYTVSVSEEGREGTYMALSSAPLFLAKLPVGILSGYLLEKYCPETLEDGEIRHSKTMWWIVGLLTATSPVLLTLCWGIVSKKESNDEFLKGVSYTELRRTSIIEGESPEKTAAENKE